MATSPTVTVKVEVSNLRQLRWLMDQWAIENGIAQACAVCGWGVFPGREHVCKVTIDVVPGDESS